MFFLFLEVLRDNCKEKKKKTAEQIVKKIFSRKREKCLKFSLEEQLQFIYKFIWPRGFCERAKNSWFVSCHCSLAV
jgi:hypothetical protein